MKTEIASGWSRFPRLEPESRSEIGYNGASQAAKARVVDLYPRYVISVTLSLLRYPRYVIRVTLSTFRCPINVISVTLYHLRYPVYVIPVTLSTLRYPRCVIAVTLSLSLVEGLNRPHLARSLPAGRRRRGTGRATRQAGTGMPRGRGAGPGAAS